MKYTYYTKTPCFYGHEVSEEGRKYNRVDYGTLAKVFDMVLNNNIMAATGFENWELVSGAVDNTEEIEKLREELKNLTPGTDEYNEKQDEMWELEEAETEFPETYQQFIVSDRGAKILKEFNQLLWYNEDLDMYLWGITHWGTSWDYVLTDIELVKGQL